MRATTMPDLGLRNELIVLAAIRHSPDGTSQSEVVDRSGLSRQAVSLITRRLRDRGLIETSGTVAGSRGKPRTILRLVPEAQLAAGVHLDPAAITVVIVDLLGREVAQHTLTPPTHDPSADIARIAQALTAAIQDLREAGWHAPGGHDIAESVLGIGVASPGGIDVERGRVENPPWLPGWRDVPLAEELSLATGLPVVLDKDTNAALTAETWSAAHPPEETVLYLYIGAGIGSAVSTGGRVHLGAAALAGEIGHLPTGLEAPQCACGRHGCLSQFTDTAAMLEQAVSLGILEAADGSCTRDHLRTLAAAAEEGDDRARQILTRFGTALGQALRTLIAVHDPHRVVIGGPSWPVLAPQVLELVRELASAGSRTEVPVHSSQHGDDVGALGAAALFLQRELSPAGR